MRGFEPTFKATSPWRSIMHVVAAGLIGLAGVAGVFTLGMGTLAVRMSHAASDMGEYPGLDAEIRAEIAALEEQRRLEGTLDQFRSQAEIDAFGTGILVMSQRSALGFGGATGLLFMAALGSLRVGRRWKAVPIKVGLHGLRWGDRTLLFEDLASVELQGRTLTVHPRVEDLVTNGSMHIHRLEELESAIRQGIERADQGVDRPEDRRHLEALLSPL